MSVCVNLCINECVRRYVHVYRNVIYTWWDETDTPHTKYRTKKQEEKRNTTYLVTPSIQDIHRTREG